MHIKRRMLTVLAVLVIGVVFFSVSGHAQADASYGNLVPEGEDAVMETDLLLFRLNTETGRVTITEKSSGFFWQSNPENIEQDNISFGINQSRVQSQLFISYKSQTKKIEETNDFDAAEGGNKNLRVYKNGDRITACYSFPQLGITIPLQYSMDEDGFSVSVLARDIREEKGLDLLTVTPLPFFGAGGMEEDGWIFIPDGSGTLINFNNRKVNEGKLTLAALYGDRSVTTEQRIYTAQPVLLPCFGIHRESPVAASMFAFAVEGADSGSITTNVAGRETAFNYANYTFLHRKNAVETLLDRTWAAKTRIVNDRETTGFDAYTIRYFLKTGGDTGLAYMAERCRSLIFPNKAERRIREVPLFADVYMGVRVKRNFLGIPYKTLQPLTTFSQAKDMADTLKNHGISDLVMRLRGFDDDGIYYGRANTVFRPSSKLGGKKGFEELISEGLTVYPNMEFIQFSRSGNGIYKWFSSVISILRERVSQPAFLLASGEPNSELDPYYILRPSLISRATDTLIKSLDKAGVQGVSVPGIGYAAYPDYSSEKSNIANTALQLKEAARKLSGRGRLMLEAPSSNIMWAADDILHLPMRSSGYNLTDYDVPFVQMVLSGHVRYTGDDINLSADKTQTLLRSIETGSALCAALMWEDYEKVADTPANNLYSATFNEQKDELIRFFEENRKALKDVYGMGIADYRIEGPTLRVVKYENGVFIAVNYSNQDAQWNGTVISPHSFAVIKEGR